MPQKPDNETNRPFNEAVWASLEGRFLCMILLSIMMQPSPPAARNPFGTVRRAASRGEIRMPRACAGSKSSRRPPALARERLPASSGRPASPACAVGSDVMQSRVFLHASPPAPRAPKGSVSPAGAWGKRKATRRREQIQELRAAGAQNAGIDGEGKRVLTKKAAIGGLFDTLNPPGLPAPAGSPTGSRQYSVFPSISVYASNSSRQLSRSNPLTVSRSFSPARYS